MPLNWLQTITKELTKENGGVPPARAKVWGRAAEELQGMQQEQQRAATRGPEFVLRQWTQRKADVEQELRNLEAEHAEHTSRALNLKGRTDLMETELLRLRAEKERSVAVSGVGCRVQGVGCRVQGVGCRV